MEDHDDGLYVDDGGWKCSGNGVDGGGRYTGNDLAKEVKLSEEKTDAAVRLCEQGWWSKGWLG